MGKTTISIFSFLLVFFGEFIYILWVSMRVCLYSGSFRRSCETHKSQEHLIGCRFFFPALLSPLHFVLWRWGGIKFSKMHRISMRDTQQLGWWQSILSPKHESRHSVNCVISIVNFSSTYSVSQSHLTRPFFRCKYNQTKRKSSDARFAFFMHLDSTRSKIIFYN